MTIKKKRYYFSTVNYKMLKNRWVNGIYLDKTGQGRVEERTPRSYVFCGDSRIVQMQKTLDNSRYQYVAKSKMGYSWFLTEGLTDLRTILKKNPRVNVVLCFGVNDLWNYKKYVQLYRKLINGYPTTRFYILSVNPVNDTDYPILRDHHKSNEAIRGFNYNMKTAFRDQYIDTYHDLLLMGFDTVDGLHYTSGTYRTLESLIVEKIESKCETESVESAESVESQ